MWDLHRSPTHGYIFSPIGDTLTFLAPVVVCFIATPFLYALVPEDTIPLWAYIVVVALTDVGHVWTTLFRAYFDSEENSRRSLLYNGTPIFMFLLCFSLHYFISESFFWTLLGYLAIFHFVRQQYGFLMLAKRRGRDVRNLKRDSLLLYAGAVIPIVLWHLDQTRKFDWFNRDDHFLHTAVSSAVETVVASVIGNTSSSSSTTSSYIPLGRWSSRLWLQQQAEEQHQQQQQPEHPLKARALSPSAASVSTPASPHQQQYYNAHHHHRSINNNNNKNDKSKFCSYHDCYGNERIPSGNGNWGDFSTFTLCFYAGSFLVVLAVILKEQLEQYGRISSEEETKKRIRKSKKKNDESSSDHQFSSGSATTTTKTTTTVTEHEEEEEEGDDDNSTAAFPFYSTKHLILVGTWITWAFGVLCPHRVVSLSFLNLFHAAPTFLVTFCTTFNRWLLWCRHEADVKKFVAASYSNDAGKNHHDADVAFYAKNENKNVKKNEDDRVRDGGGEELTSSSSSSSSSVFDRFALWMLLSSTDGGKTTPFLSSSSTNRRSAGSQKRSFASSWPSSSIFSSLKSAAINNKKLLCFSIFLGFLFLLGLAEEYLWETLIWHDFTEQLWDFNPAEEFSPLVYSAVTALLILPQAVHYFLDAFLWKHGPEENPGLAVAMAMETARNVPSEWLKQQA